MGKPIKFEVIGLNKANKYLISKKKNVKSRTDDSIKVATKYVKGEVKDSIQGRRAEPRSVDTGELLSSVEDVYTQFAGIIRTMVKHGSFIEYGTIRIPARRHFNNSLNRNKRKIQDIFSGIIKTI